MRYTTTVFSAFLFALFFALPAHAQVCTETSWSLEDFSVNTGEISWIELKNDTSAVLNLDGQIMTNAAGDEYVLTGILLPGETKILHLSSDFLEPIEEQTPVYQTGSVSLSELFANPAEDETTGEFIELFNAESVPIMLDGWQVADKSKSFFLDGLEIPANGYLTLYRSTTGIALNNTSETVELIDPFGSVLDVVDYASTTEDVSWNAAATWYEAAPSPGQSNHEPMVEEEPEETTQPEEPKESQVQTPPAASQLDENLDQIQLSELLPNPEGSDDEEWIELFNPTEFLIALDGLTVTDGSGIFLFTNESMQPDSYLVLHREDSGIALNNSGDSVALVIDEVEIDQFAYSSSTEGLSWGIVDGEWTEQIPSPGEKNVILEQTEEEADEQPQEDSEQTATAAKKTTEYALWQTAQHNEIVQVSGMITVPNSLLKAKTLFVSTAAGIIEVYSSKNLFPDHLSGQQVTLIGKKSITSTGERLLFQKAEDMLVHGSTSIPPTALYQKSDADTLQTGAIVQLTGRLIEQNEKDLILELNDDEWNISLEHLPQQNLLPLDHQLTITGALKITDTEPEIIPFLPEHIQQHEAEKITQETIVEPATITTETTKQLNEPILIGGGIAGIGSYLLRERIVSFLKGLLHK